MNHKTAVVLIAGAFLMRGMLCSACDLPAPATVSTEVLALWAQRDFSGVNDYIQNMQNTCPLYLPTLLALSFRAVVYAGDFDSAKGNLTMIQQYLNRDRSPGRELFYDRVSHELTELSDEVAMHQRLGHDVKGAVSVQAVRDAWGDLAPPMLNMIAGAPDATIVNGNSLPTASITSPKDGSEVSADSDLTLAAAASDSDGAVARVEFYEGTSLIGVAKKAPYVVTWPKVRAGSYVLKAVAVDETGATGTSAPVRITAGASTP